MTAKIKRLLADAMETARLRQYGSVDADEKAKLRKHDEEAKAALVAGLDALTGAACAYLAEATFPARSDDCLTCGGALSVVHTPRCTYDAAERALRDTLAAR